MKKRGMIELQFHWIFVLVAGAVIFIFFMNIVNKQREYSEIKTSGIITTNLESILIGAQISTDTVNIVDIPKVDIGFECNRYFIGSIPKQTKGNVIFAPGLLKGKQLITWALDWSVPFRVTNFLYLTDPMVRYVVVYDGGSEGTDYSGLATEIDEELPKEMNKELLPQNQLVSFKNKNNYKVKFIFLSDSGINAFDSLLNELGDMPNGDVTAIQLIDIENPSSVHPTGTLKFFNNQNGVWDVEDEGGQEETFYLKKESLFGAIFAENLEMYNCVMKKAFKKLNLVSKVYHGRSTALKDGLYSSGACNGPHAAVLSHLNNIKTKSGEMSKGFPNTNFVEQIKEWAYKQDDSIEHENDRAQLFSCVLIY